MGLYLWVAILITTLASFGFLIAFFEKYEALRDFERCATALVAIFAFAAAATGGFSIGAVANCFFAAAAPVFIGLVLGSVARNIVLLRRKKK